MQHRTTRRGVLAGAGALLAGAAGCSAPSSRGAADPEATTQFRVTPSREGYRDVRAPATVELDWRLPGVNVGEHTAAKASPVPLPDGDVVVPGDTGVVQRVGPDGTVRWRAATDPAVRGIHGTPAVANGLVYVGAYEGSLYAFDLETGVREWRADLGDAIGASPAYVDGLVYIAVEYFTPSGAVFAVDGRSGSVVWSDHRPANHPHSSPAIDRPTGTLVVGDNDGVLHAWDVPAMERAWTFETGDAIKGPIATHDGAAYFGSWDEHVYRVDLATGTADWAFAADHDVMSGPGVDPDGQTVYIGSHDDHLYALDAATGDEVWSFETGGWLLGCPAVTRDAVLAGSYDGYCYCVEKATGEERWRAAGLAGWVTSTPLVDGDAVYFTDRASADEPGSLYRYRAV